MSTKDESDKVVALYPWEHTVRSAEARRRAFALLDREDVDDVIRRMSPLEVYHAVKEIGLEDATPILSLLDGEQIRALVDLDAWHAHRFALSDLLTWLEAFRSASPESLVAAIRALDVEEVATLLRRRLFIATKPREDDTVVPDWIESPPEGVAPLVETPDGRFIIAARVTDEDPEVPEELDEEERKSILAIVDDLYRDRDWEHVATALRLAETDLSTNLEEDAYRFRNARMEDLGFPPLERAIEVYGPLDPSVLGQPPKYDARVIESHLPALHAHALAEGLFHAALSAIESRETVRRIESELVPLANAVLVADRVEPGNADGLREALGRVRNTIEIALSHEIPPSLRMEGARARLESRSVRELFRVGYTLTLRLASRARKLAPHRAWFDDAEREVIDALLETRPLFATVMEGACRALEAAPNATAMTVLETVGLRTSARETERPFARTEDLVIAEAVLSDLDALVVGFDALGMAARAAAIAERRDPLNGTPMDASTWLSTAGANAMIGKAFVVEPLDGAELAELVMKARDATWNEAQDEVVSRALLTLEEPARRALERRVRRGLEALAEALAAIDGSRIDPRFVGNVLCRVE